MMTKEGVMKMGDFGISKILQWTGESALSSIGTPHYFSPEICLNQPYSYQSDVWAVGCIVQELCTLETPFKSPNLLQLLKNVVGEQ